MELTTDRLNHAPIRIGISACLLGEEVRFDGGHKRDRFLVDILGPHVEWLPICPEVAIGLGTPRETLRLVRSAGHGELRMVTTRTGVDHTEAMNSWAVRRVDELAAEPDLCGYVLKKDSPSCGLEHVKTFEGEGDPQRDGQGLFASTLVRRLPLLPVEDEGRLSTAEVRDSFVERIFAYRRLKDLFVAGWSLDGLVRFHTAHKMALLAHSRAKYDELGRLVAHAGSLPKDELRDKYEHLFMSALAIATTPGRHADVLEHMAGHLKKVLDSPTRVELQQAIDDYRRRGAPLARPLDLLRRHAVAHDVTYLLQQSYLVLDPPELMLRDRT